MVADGPLVSIVICAYQQAEFVNAAVDSALAQSYPNTELIVVDNGSTDGTAERLGAYRDRPNVRLLLHRENAPPTRRLNEAIRLARGEYVSILYGDDEYLPEKTALQVEAFSGLGPDYGVVHSGGYRESVTSGERWLYPSSTVSGEALRPLLDSYHRPFVNPISPLIRRACFERYPFAESLFFEGEGIFLRIALHWKFFFLDRPLVVMREHPRNLGKAYAPVADVSIAHLDVLGGEPEFPPALRPKLRAIRSAINRNAAWQMVRLANDAGAARSRLVTAVRDDPRQALHPRTLGALALALLPEPVRSFANLVGNRLRRRRVSLAVRTRLD